LALPEIEITWSLLSNGRRVRRLTVPAMPPSIISAVWFL
jgi:hypothetical protein